MSHQLLTKTCLFNSLVAISFFCVVYYCYSYSATPRSDFYSELLDLLPLPTDGKLLMVQRFDLQLEERVRRLNRHVDEMKTNMTLAYNSNTTSTFVTTPVTRVYVDNKYNYFLKIITRFNGVRAIALAWVDDNLYNTSNVFIKKYFRHTMDEFFCQSMTNGQSSSFKYEVYYNGSSNCRLFNVSLQVALRMQSFNEGPVWPNSKVPATIFTTPPLATLYLLIIEDAVSSAIGNVFTSEFKFYSHGCPRGEDLPNNWITLPYFDHVFVITQYWGTGHYHRSIEVLPRLAPFLDFLKKNTDVYILCPDAGSEMLKETFNVLGLEPERIISGWVRAGLLYVPKPTPCGYSSITETQMLAREYRKYIRNKLNSTRVARNSLVFIKRSRRTFAKTDAVIESLRSFAAEFKLDFKIFSNSPLPSLNDTMLMFASARVIVAPHGAGLSNMIYSTPGTLILEGLYEMWHANLCYERLAFFLGMQYYGALSNGGNMNTINVEPERIIKILRHYLENGLV